MANTPNDDDAGTDTNSPDEIDEMITDEDLDPDTDELDDDDFCEDVIGVAMKSMHNGIGLKRRK
jgi:hypothetical protein